MMVACDLQKMERSDGHVVFSEEEIDVLNSIKDMVWKSGSFENIPVPSELQTLTFGFWFNQSLDNTTLPGGLQTLTFGVLRFQSELNRQL